MLECFVKVSLKVDQKSIKARKSQETTCGWEVLTIGGLEIKTVSWLLIKKSTIDASKTGLSKILFESFDQKSIFEVEGVDDFDRSENLDSGKRSKISEIFHKLAKMKLPSCVVVTGQSNLVRTVL
jgi:hypothetical protein